MLTYLIQRSALLMVCPLLGNQMYINFARKEDTMRDRKPAETATLPPPKPAPQSDTAKGDTAPSTKTSADKRAKENKDNQGKQA
jgi:hypothetical protein